MRKSKTKVVIVVLLISFVTLGVALYLFSESDESEKFLESYGIDPHKYRASVLEELDKKTTIGDNEIQYSIKLLDIFIKKKLGEDKYKEYLKLKKMDSYRGMVAGTLLFISIGVIATFYEYLTGSSERTSYLIEEIEEAQAKRRSRAIRKYIKRLFITILSAGALAGVGYYVMWRWQQGKLGPEENAAIITSIGSTITLGITLIVTAYFNKQAIQATLKESRATIRDKTLDVRIERYPTLQKYVMELNKMVHPDSVESTFEQHFQKFIDYHQERKFYSSQVVKEYISHLVKLSQEIHKKEADLERQKFKEISQELIDQFDKELDLASLIDDDLKPLG
jgi:hypothetical protein